MVTDSKEMPIKDALHIYNVKNVVDRHLPGVLEIWWDSTGRKAILLLNGYPHAVFDFDAERGYCRTGFPPSLSSGWSKDGHMWDETVLAQLDWRP